MAFMELAKDLKYCGATREPNPALIGSLKEVLLKFRLNNLGKVNQVEGGNTLGIENKNMARSYGVKSFIKNLLFWRQLIDLIGHQLPRWLSGKESACQSRSPRFDPRVGKISEEEMAPTPVFLPGKPHVQNSLVGCSSWGLKESDVTEYVCTHSGGMIKGHDHIWF